MTDLRIYCTEDYKKQVKTVAVQKGVSVSDLLMDIVQRTIPKHDPCANMIAELEHINTTLAINGGRMTAEERQALPYRSYNICQT